MERNVNKNLVAALFIVVAVLGYGLIGKAGNLEPSQAPAPTMKTLDEVEPRIPISQADIPLTISTRGSYYLTEDVTAAGTAITVAADDVTIDLAGFALVGPDSGTNFGIRMNARSNVEIRNGTVRDFHYGIYESSSSGQDHRVIDVRAVSNGRGGIYLHGFGHLVKDCTVSNNGTSAPFVVYGIYTGYSSTVTGNSAYDNGNGAASSVHGIFAGSGSTVTGNTAYDNGNGATGLNVDGIYAASGSTVTGNTAYDNGNGAAGYVYGIKLNGNNLVDQNTAYSNGTGAGSATEITYGVAGCVYGINVPPAP